MMYILKKENVNCEKPQLIHFAFSENKLFQYDLENICATVLHAKGVGAHFRKNYIPTIG